MLEALVEVDPSPGAGPVDVADGAAKSPAGLRPQASTRQGTSAEMRGTSEEHGMPYRNGNGPSRSRGRTFSSAERVFGLS